MALRQPSAPSPLRRLWAPATPRPRGLVLATFAAMAAVVAAAALTFAGQPGGVAPAPGANAGVRLARAPDAAQTPLVLGAAVNWDRLRQPGPYQSLFLRHFQALTPETELKMDALAPQPGRLDFSRADALVDWARAHGITVNGHTLLWQQQQPPWLSARSWTHDELLAVLRWYVQGVVAHFRGRVASWDVVNEPLVGDGSLRPNIWQRVIGDDYIAYALRYAREADPAVRLMINDYGIERPGPKADGMVALLSRLRRDGVPLDAVGVQSHVTTSWAPTDTALQTTMARFAALDLGVDITELDVATQPGDAELLRQAEIYHRFGLACRQQPACSRVTTWGFTDASTWLGSAARPLLFDEAGRGKPAWPALIYGLGGVP
jgi:endo-1,4-beta-xylanase